MTTQLTEPWPVETFPVEIPTGGTVAKNGKYYLICGIWWHPLAGLKGRVGYHRYVLYEALGRPKSSQCNWCGYVLPWKTTLAGAVEIVINADHVDGNTENNHPSNLVPSCAWCNKNRSWAENHPEFWERWRRWMADVPPCFRPSLPDIARDCSICAFPEQEAERIKARHSAGLRTFMERKHGEEWETFYDTQDAEEEFSQWLEDKRRDED